MVSSSWASTEAEEGVWHSAAHTRLIQGGGTCADSAVDDGLLGY